METLWQDVKFSLRIFRRSPVIVIITVLSLAFGIGANTAIFSLVNSALLRTLPVAEPQELALFYWAAENPVMVDSINGWMTRNAAGQRTSTSFPFPVFNAFHARQDAFQDLFGFAALRRLNVSVNGQAEIAGGQLVTGNYFSALGLRPFLGRLLTPTDDTDTSSPTAVISHRFWQLRFGEDPAIVGSPINLNGHPFTLVGIAPKGFDGSLQAGTTPSVFVSMSSQSLVLPSGDRRTMDDYWWMQIMGRLKTGMTLESAQAQANLIFNQTMEPRAQAIETRRAADPSQESTAVEIPTVDLLPGGQGLREARSRMRSPLFIATIIAGLVLVIACANVANLLLARSTARRREIAVRRSLGAGRSRLVRQLLTESTVLAFVGGILGVGLTYLSGDLVLQILAGRPGGGVGIDPTPNPQVLAFSVGLSLLTGLLFGLAPALQASRTELASSLKQSGVDASGAAGGSRLRFGKSLVVGQVSLSVVLLVLAGLFIRTLDNLKDIDPGFNPDQVLVFRLDPTLNGYEGEALANLYEHIREDIAAQPGIDSVTVSPFTLLSNQGWWSSVDIVGRESEDRKRIFVQSVAPNFLETMEIPLLTGRSLTVSDNTQSQAVAVVNETFLREHLEGKQSPIGERFIFGRDEWEKEIEIVGMTRDALNDSLRRDVMPTIYVPFQQQLHNLGSVSFSVRTTGDPAEATEVVRAAVSRADTNLPVFSVKTLNQQIVDSLVQERHFAQLSSAFGLVAVVLASIGLYGLLSYSVSQRTREIGIRIALGARKRDVLSLVMNWMWLAVLGAGIGIGLAIGLTRLAGSELMEEYLYGLSAGDPITFAAGGLIMLVVAALAAFLPARRASKVDPMVALRFE